jgi:16S rRNA (guanine527-N7)-methyltransferase
MDHLAATSVQTLERFAALVEASPHNLVSRSARRELLTRHVPESIELARLLPENGGRLLDLGSGGGFPGMVIAVVRPDYEVHLLDATRKKTDFLAAAALELGIEVTIHTGRAEELARPPLAASFHVVTARAVAPLERLIPWAMPYLAEQGVLYAVKGERWREELADASIVLRRVGGQVLATPDDLSTADRVAEAAHPHVVMIGRAR